MLYFYVSGTVVLPATWRTYTAYHSALQKISSITLPLDSVYSLYAVFQSFYLAE